MKAEDLSEFVSYLEAIGMVDRDQAEGILQLPSFEVKTLHRRDHFGSDTMLYRLDVDLNTNAGILSVDAYNASLLQLSFAHGVYEGINTRELDKRLSEHNWQGIELQDLNNSDIALLTGELIRLSQSSDGVASSTAGMLMLRHWSDTALELFTAGIVDRQKYERSMQFPLKSPIGDITTEEAYHMLCGRPVLRANYDEGLNGDVMHWRTIDGDTFKEWPFFDLSAQLKGLPLEVKLDDNTGPAMITRLAMGERVPVVVVSRGVPLRAELEVDAPQGTLAVYRRDGTRLDMADLLREGTLRQSQSIQGDKHRKGPAL